MRDSCKISGHVSRYRMALLKGNCMCRSDVRRWARS